MQIIAQMHGPCSDQLFSQHEWHCDVIGSTYHCVGTFMLWRMCQVYIYAQHVTLMYSRHNKSTGLGDLARSDSKVKSLTQTNDGIWKELPEIREIISRNL